jgi:ATP-dependent Lon protease
VRKTVSGLLKILHPHGEWTRGELTEYLEFAMEGRRRVKEQLKKLAAHDYSKTAFSYIERDTGREVWVEALEQPEELDVVADDQPPKDSSLTEITPVEGLLVAGESKHVEFKATARWNMHVEKVDKEIEHAVLKSVAGFMNARGGTLLVGVDDTGEPVGLDRDLATVHRRDLDGFEAWLTTLMEGGIGGAATSNADIDFPTVNGTTICRIRVHPSGSPTYVSMKDDEWFYVRLGNSTRRLSTREALDYIKQRWNG